MHIDYVTSKSVKEGRPDDMLEKFDADNLLLQLLKSID